MVTPGTSAFTRPRRAVLGGCLAFALVVGLGVGVALPARADDVNCSGDQCDEGRWQAARGIDNSGSFWQMSPGHNCTNYVAWRLIQNGIETPRTHPGDAAEWASNAIADGYTVDSTPEVGAVAQWESLAGGNGVDGHVAYIEQVNDDGTMVISEDYWHGGDQSGPLTYRTVPITSPSHIIHYGTHPDWLRLLGVADAQWRVASTGLDPAPTALSAMTLDGASPIVFFAQDGVLVEATRHETGWQAVATSVPTTATTMGAVNMGNGMPYVMTVDNGVLVMSVETGSGWQVMSTGIELTGEVAAVDLGGLWPTVFLSQGGSLYRIWGDMMGWHSEDTGAEVWGPISAALSPTGWPEIYSVENGMLFQTWLDQTGWHRQLTGITASGRTSAVSTPTGVQVMLIQDESVFRIQHAGTEWTKEPTGADGGALISAVNLGDGAPTLVQVG